MVGYILGGEVLFWALLLAGVSSRYLLGWRVTSAGLLLATPVVDLAIIALTYVDLAGGARSDFSHGLAAFYVGFSIVFGPEIIARFDRRFARRFTGLSEEQLPPVLIRTDLAYLCRCLIASGITVVLLTIGIALASWADSFWLIYWIVVAVSTAVLWALFGPIRKHWGRSRKRDSPDRPTSGED